MRCEVESLFCAARVFMPSHNLSYKPFLKEAGPAATPPLQTTASCDAFLCDVKRAAAGLRGAARDV